MKLHAKVIVLLSGLFAAYGAIDYAIQRRVILPSFTALEADLARTDMQRASHALTAEGHQLLMFCVDWGNWLESYQFMQKRDMRFVDQNITQSAVEAANVNVVAFIDNDGRFVWRKGYQPERFTDASFKLLSGNALAEQTTFRDEIAEGKTGSGILDTEHGPMLVAVAPILDGAGNGPHRGALLVGRLLTQELIQKLGEQAEVKLHMLTPARDDLDRESEDPAAIHIVQRDKTNEVYRSVLNAQGKPALTFEVDVPRSITERGEIAVRFAFISLLISGVIVTVALLIGLRRLILRPVSQITRHAVSIGESDDLTHRLGIDRSDELGVLARELDRMLDRSAEARRRLVDKSFEAGLAEMAGGVLHNIGNALTPIAVNSASIQNTLAELPSADLQMVLDELENGAPDAARRNDLQEFLRLAGAETLKANEQVAADLNRIMESVLAIQAMLNDRVQYSRGGPVIEAVRLTEVIRQALALVPPLRLSLVEVVIDDSVNLLGTVLIARVAMQQVFQNLIVNACEAMRTGERGQIKVSAHAVGKDGERKLEVMFSDNGTGIAPEHLSTIFNKGFSTKPLENNSGLGLHWSANVVASLGGRIYAESPGPDGGAVFHVILPLHRTAYDPRAIAA